MINMSNLLNLQGQLFLLMLAGFLFRKYIVGEAFQTGLTDVLINLILPCNIITSFQIQLSEAIFRDSLAIMAISLANQLICIALGAILFRWCAEDNRPSLKYGTLCSNAGFLGMPVAEGICGKEGLLLASVFLIPQRVFMWSVGVSYFHKEKKNILLALLKNPCIDAVIVGLFLMIGNIPLPVFLDRAISSFASCNTGMSMFLIGMIAAKIRAADFVNREILWFSAIRLVLIPLISLVICRAVGTDALTTGLATLLAAMPAGGTTAVLAAKYNRNPQFAVGCVATSTILSLIAIPLWGMLL